MFFSEEFIAKVEENPISGIVEACQFIFDKLEEISHSNNNNGWSEIEHELLWESASFINLFIRTEQLSVIAQLPNITGNIETNCQKVYEYLKDIDSQFKEHSIKLKVESYTGRYNTVLKSSFAYEFSQGDFERIQTLVNELRNQIIENQNFEEDHKRRLLKRLENLQAELHKRVSNLDVFWGLVGDAGVVLGKLGNDAKPIVDKTREIAQIVWNTQARSEELSSNSQNPMLGHDDNT